MAQVVSVVPTINNTAVILNGRIQKTNGAAEAIEFLEGLAGGDTVLTAMGGAGQNLFVRARQMGLNVQRIPWFALEQLVPGSAGASGEERARALKNAWEKNSSEFYPLEELDQTVLTLRELTRVRLNIQEYRKMAQLQYQAAWRDLAPLFPAELMDRAYDAALVGSASKNPKAKLKVDYTSSQFKEFLASLPRAQRDAVELRVMFADAGMIRGALNDETLLERRITQLANQLDIWHWLHPGKGAVLPEVKGLGPSLGGSLIGEIGDIKRFPTPLHLRAYARFHVASRLALEDEEPTHFKADPETQEPVGYVGVFPRRKRGEVSNWSRYLNRAVWLWSTDQMPRYDHVWRDLYYHFKWQEMLAHPEPVKVDVGEGKTITKYSLGHLDKRAKRRTGSALLEYVWGLWIAGDSGQDVDEWFLRGSRHSAAITEQHSWGDFFNEIAAEVNDGLYERVQAESDRRRALQPKSEDEQSED